MQKILIKKSISPSSRKNNKPIVNHPKLMSCRVLGSPGHLFDTKKYDS